MLSFLGAEKFLEKEINWSQFIKALLRLGEPGMRECYGYVPVLAAGGSKNTQNLRMMNLPEHLALIYQMAGPVLG